AQNWYDFYLGAGYPLTPGKQYALVWRAPGADESNPIYYLASSAGTYAGGHLTTSAGGAAWADMAAYDALFQEWGAAG
ncbi:MAG: hypothetical protein HYX96_03150, partial [Chloroflexi bacterium]|nr:hypothetical protein [Chloroflexota bacterium]